MELEFTKMHGIGNDFVLFDFRQAPRHLTHDQIMHIADRRFGIGCDQVLVLEDPRHPQADVYYRIFNANGGEVQQCGNGARCIAAYLRQNGYPDSEMIVAETGKDLLELRFTEDNQVTVNMGRAVFDPAGIPLQADQQQAEYTLSTSHGDVRFMALSMGNPHAVLLVEDVDRAAVAELGPGIQNNPVFPQGVNVGFMQIIDPSNIRLRVYERGAGETLACGSGACAAVVAGQCYHGLQSSVKVNLRGGDLFISCEASDQPVHMTGPATTVFRGKITL
ncbi:MAG: diaminopimelate epimerase [Thiotrichales bacterium]|nr:diaminopimelate epimerase [Thiotrichales bacterium]